MDLEIHGRGMTRRMGLGERRNYLLQLVRVMQTKSQMLTTFEISRKSLIYRW